MRLSTNSLTFRMLKWVVLVQLILIPLLLGGLLYLVQLGFENQFVNHARSDAYIMASSIESTNDVAILDEAFMGGRISHASIYDVEGNELYLSEHTDLELPEDFYFSDHDDDSYNIIISLNGMDQLSNAVLKLSYDETSTYDQIATTYIRGTMFALVYIMLSILLIIWIGRKMTTPIDVLRSLSRDIAHGQYNQEISVNTNISEIKSLASTLEFMRDELVTQSEAMEHHALHDRLTGLPNRSLLNDRVSQILNNCCGDSAFSLLLLDLDNFKEINDSFGHLAGDNVLIEVSSRLCDSVRRSDTVCRMGGDEFVILLPTAHEEAALNTGKHILQKLSEPMMIESYSMRIGASIGVVSYPFHSDSFEELFRYADIAMYAAKQDATKVKFYEPSLSKGAFKKLTLASDLRDAVENNEMFTVYQPKIDLKTGHTVGAEALVRWRHPEKGIIPPVDFIPIAEKTGVITQITKIMLEDVISKLGEWLSAGIELSVSVNITAYDLDDAQLAENITLLLSKYNVAPKYLELEITESAIINDPLKALESLETLYVLGVKIALDDFGTGYSSLSQLRKLPLSVLKIDRSFIASMLDNDGDFAIVKATIDMGHDLGLQIIAEGVEDKNTLDELNKLGCELAQGYYISKPVEYAKFLEFIEKQRKAA